MPLTIYFAINVPHDLDELCVWVCAIVRLCLCVSVRSKHTINSIENCIIGFNEYPWHSAQQNTHTHQKTTEIETLKFEIETHMWIVVCVLRQNTNSQPNIFGWFVSRLPFALFTSLTHWSFQFIPFRSGFFFLLFIFLSVLFSLPLSPFHSLSLDVESLSFVCLFDCWMVLNFWKWSTFHVCSIHACA